MTVHGILSVTHISDAKMTILFDQSDNKETEYYKNIAAVWYTYDIASEVIQIPRSLIWRC